MLIGHILDISYDIVDPSKSNIPGMVKDTTIRTVLASQPNFTNHLMALKSKLKA